MVMRTLCLTSANEAEVRKALRRPTTNLAEIRQQILPILRAVRAEGDRALLHFTRELDHVSLARIRVPCDEIRRASERLPQELLAAIGVARANLAQFHKEETESAGVRENTPGVYCWRETRPLDRVGLYIPGGTAALFSTALMLVVPARLAGVREIALCSPPRPDGYVADSILAVCSLMGVNEVYAVGGAQAVAALAFGTESVRKVDKIAGPGNVYVSAAKAEVSMDPDGAAIDMLAGPSELLIIADDSCDPRFIAADLLSQAEHGSGSQVVLLTTSRRLLTTVSDELTRQLAGLPRSPAAADVLKYSVAVLVPTLSEAVHLANDYAPEHLSIQTENPQYWLRNIRNAGSVFLGPFAPETVGDYCSGTNHVLPTFGQARSHSGVSVRTFQKTLFIQQLTYEGLNRLRSAASTMARAEGLEAHARSVEIRFQT
jgi:histidinol dehydrogenase